MSKLIALVAYYPPYLPHTTTSFPPSLDVLIHIASSQRMTTRHPSYTYPGTSPGFAESDLDEYDKPAARLAWSRTLGVIRGAFGMHADLERIWDRHTELEFAKKDNVPDNTTELVTITCTLQTDPGVCQMVVQNLNGILNWYGVGANGGVVVGSSSTPNKLILCPDLNSVDQVQVVNGSTFSVANYNAATTTFKVWIIPEPS